MEEGLTKPEWKDLTTLNADCSTSKRVGVATGDSEARTKSERTSSRSVREGGGIDYSRGKERRRYCANKCQDVCRYDCLVKETLGINSTPHYQISANGVIRVRNG